MYKPKVISFANKNHGGLENLKNSMHESWEHIIVGQGLEWKGWLTRMQTICNYLKNISNKEEIVVTVDAFDVLNLLPSFQFLLDFETFQTDIVVGCENSCGGNCHIPRLWWQHYGIDVNLEFKYANGGLLCGKVQALIDMYEYSIQHNIEDDQIAIGQYMDTFPEKINMDIHHVLFYNDCNGSSNIIFNEQNHSIQLTNPNNYANTDRVTIRPYFIHFPGLALPGSIPILNVFNPSLLFSNGKNYDIIGKKINKSKHISNLPPEKKVFVPYLWVERVVCIIVIITLFFLCCYLQKRRKHQKKTRIVL